MKGDWGHREAKMLRGGRGTSPEQWGKLSRRLVLTRPSKFFPTRRLRRLSDSWVDSGIRTERGTCSEAPASGTDGGTNPGACYAQVRSHLQIYVERHLLRQWIPSRQNGT